VKNVNKTKKELEEEVNLLSTMLEALVELLENKGVLTQEEWEKTIKKHVILR
jgi:sensor domain CHASE-containing protein